MKCDHGSWASIPCTRVASTRWPCPLASRSWRASKVPWMASSAPAKVAPYGRVITGCNGTIDLSGLDILAENLLYDASPPTVLLNNTGATNLMLGRNDVQEATVVSNAYSGQYGQQAGAQVNYVTKSGTNQFHGNAIYYWNGSSMNANGWFNNAQDVAKPFANNNQWAASLGGPIKKDKLFFFADTEGIRFVLPASAPVFVWSPNYVAGSLAAIAASNPAELPLYTKYYQIMQSAPGYAGGATAFGAGDGGCDLGDRAGAEHR